MQKDGYWPISVRLPKITSLAITARNSFYSARERIMSYTRKMLKHFCQPISKVILFIDCIYHKEGSKEASRLRIWASPRGFLTTARQRHLHSGGRSLETFQRTPSKAVYSHTVSKSGSFSRTCGQSYGPLARYRGGNRFTASFF